MNRLRLMIKQNAVYFSGLMLLFLAGIFLLVMNGNASSFLLLNTFHFSWLNNFFLSYTLVGDGAFAICLAVIYFFIVKKQIEAFLIFYSFLLSGIIVQIVKHLFFSPRPKLFFGNTYHSYFIDGIEFYHNNSFPSGHTTTAFAVATVLILLSKDKKVQLPALFAALLVAYSRVYLGQHFLSDVLVGALIGVIAGIGCVYIAQHFKFTGYSFRPLNLKTSGSVTSLG